MHELATNALKYGAWSEPRGHVAIDGGIDRSEGDGRLRFVWQETGGPPVTTPARRGFGTVILVDAARGLARNVALNYAPQGLRYELELPLRDIEAPPAPAQGAIGRAQAV